MQSQSTSKRRSGRSDRRVLSPPPPGVDKLPLLEELIRRLAENWSPLTVLLLTATPDLASEYAGGLRQILGESHPAQLAGSLSELMSEVHMPGSITVASIHRQIFSKCRHSWPDDRLCAPCSTAPRVRPGDIRLFLYAGIAGQGDQESILSASSGPSRGLIQPDAANC